MKIKTSINALIILATALTASHCLADECGKRLTEIQIDRYLMQIESTQKNLSLHRGALQDEASKLNSIGAHDKSMRNYDEDGLIDSAQRSADYVVIELSKSLMLSQLKSMMIDQRDKVAVERFLSLVAVYVGKSSQAAQERLGQILSRVSRPGVAIDIAKLRDILTATTKDFGVCNAPSSTKSRAN